MTPQGGASAPSAGETVPVSPAALRAWVSAARGVVEWLAETGVTHLPVPPGYTLPPLGRIAPADAPFAGALGASRDPAPGRVVDAPQVSHGGPSPFAGATGQPAPPVARAVPEEAAVVSSVTTEAVVDGTGGVTTEQRRALALAVIDAEVASCTRCALSGDRHEAVRGVGGATARLLFVADSPGPAEDQTGLPFVGPSGLLLSKMIAAMGLRRRDVWLTYLTRCASHRGPRPDELLACRGYFDREVDLVSPEVIVVLGEGAAAALLNPEEGLASLRGTWHTYRDRPAVATFHPDALLQAGQLKAQVWDDLRRVMRRLGLREPGRGARR